MNGFALRQPQSDRLTVVAWILTRTWSSFGTGRSTSSIRRTSGGPYLSWTTALMVPFVLARRGGTRSRVDSFDALPTLESTERDPRPLGWRRPLGRRRCACSVATHTEVRHDALRVQGPRHGQAPRGRAECIGRRGWKVVGVTTKKQLFIAPPQAVILMREVELDPLASRPLARARIGTPG